MSHFLTTKELRAYLLGHKEARHAAAEIAATPNPQEKDT